MVIIKVMMLLSLGRTCTVLGWLVASTVALHCTYEHIFTCTCRYVYTYMYIYICIHIYVYIYMYMYMHMYVYLQLYLCFLKQHGADVVLHLLFSQFDH